MARWMATSDEEQAVSTVTAGPSSPRVYATRPVAMLPALPPPTYPARASASSVSGVRSVA